MSDYDYPYTGVVGPCKFEEEKVAAKVLDFSDIPKGDEAAFKESLYSAGPVVAMMNGESLQFYDGGVFDPLVCKVTKLTHVVSCVGYGVDPKKKKEFWKCKNSWGDNWGE